MHASAPKARRGVLAAAATTCALLLTTGTAHADLSDSELRAITDKYLFEISLDSFIHIRDQAPYSDQLDWSSDGCTSAPDRPAGYHFENPCKRHDFGYSNYKSQQRFTEDNRLRIDNKFRSDMYSVCGNDIECQRIADAYYLAVREFGNKSASTDDALRKAGINKG